MRVPAESLTIASLLHFREGPRATIRALFDFLTFSDERRSLREVPWSQWSHNTVHVLQMQSTHGRTDRIAHSARGIIYGRARLSASRLLIWDPNPTAVSVAGPSDSDGSDGCNLIVFDFGRRARESEVRSCNPGAFQCAQSCTHILHD